MTEKSPLLYIEHVLESITSIQEYLGDCNKKQLRENHMMYDAILRNLQTLSELSTSFSSAISGINRFEK